MVLSEYLSFLYRVLHCPLSAFTALPNTNKTWSFVGLMSMARIDPKPPDPLKLQECRELRLKQKQMKLIMYDIVWYFIFVTVLLSVAHGNKDPMAYDTTSTMSNFFEDNSYTDWISLTEVTCL